MRDEVLRGYAAAAPRLIGSFEALSSEAVLAPVRDLLPSPPARILDIGAGTGRDGGWLRQMGHAVTAAEPVAELREAGAALHPALRWIDDCLPHLDAVAALGEGFDLVLLVGVWQHLPRETHPSAVAALAALLDRHGRLILSIRHGPGPRDRPCFRASPDEICAWADAEGLGLLARREAASIQPTNRAAGVTWTWLALERCG